MPRIGPENVALIVGSGSDAIDLFAAGVPVNDLRWSSEMPGGYVSLDCAIPTKNPLYRVRNQIVDRAPAELIWKGATVWKGKLLPPEWDIGIDDGVLRLAAAGTLEEAKRNTTLIHGWTDADPANWFVPHSGNDQFSTNQQGQLIVYLNKGSPAINENPGELWYWPHFGLRSQYIEKLIATFAVNVNAANWEAGIAHTTTSPPFAASTVTYGANAWANETDSGSDQEFTFAANTVAIMLQLVTTTDVTEVANTRYIKLTDAVVYLASALPSIDSAMWDLLGSSGLNLCSEREYETLATLNHLIYSDPMSAAEMLTDIGKHSSSIIDWALWGAKLYCKARASATAPNTVALKRQHLAGHGSDQIIGAHEYEVDYVRVIYGTDSDGTNNPSGWPMFADYPSTPTTFTAARVLIEDRSGEIMSSTAAQNIGQQIYTQRNTDAHRGQVSVPLRAPLESQHGGELEPGHIIAGQRWIDRTYELGHEPIMVTTVEADLDGDSVTLGVGPLEERELYQPFDPGPLGVDLKWRREQVERKGRQRWIRYREFR